MNKPEISKKALPVEKSLREKFPYWFSIERIANQLFFQIKDNLGQISKEDYERIFNLYIEPYYRTWDGFAGCVNGDYEYPPVIFCLFAESIGLKPTYPIKIMRSIAYQLTESAAN